MDYYKQFESYVVKKNTEARKRLSTELNITFSTTPPPPKLLPKPEIQNRILEQLPNIMPSLTPAPGIHQENGRRVRKSTIESRNKCRSKNLTPLLIPAYSNVKKKEPLRKVKKPRINCKVTKKKTTTKVVAKSTRKLKLEIIPVDQEDKPALPEEPLRKVRKATVGRRKYCKTKKTIPESATRTKRKYVKSLKYSKKAKALLSEKLENMKRATETEQSKQLETCKVEENNTVEREIDSIEDSQEEILQELSVHQKLPRIKHSYLKYYQVYNIGFAETSKGIVFKCFSKICKFQTYDQSIFKNHLINFHHNDISNDSGTFCAFCNEVFTSSSFLQELEHINEKHLEFTSNSVNFNEKYLIDDMVDLPLMIDESLNLEDASESKNTIENSFMEDSVVLPPKVEMTSILEDDSKLKKVSNTTIKSSDDFEIVHTKNNLQYSDANDFLVDISDDEFEQLTCPSKTISTDTNIQDFSDISSEEENSIFNESFDIKDGSMFDFNGLSSDESTKSYKTVSSNTNRINKILNNPDFCVQRILHDGKRNQTFKENSPKNRNKSEKLMSTKISQIATQVPVQTPIQSLVQTQIQVTVKEPVVMNKLNIRALQPWIEKRPNFKYEVSCLKMLEKNALFATYKCMGFTCSYYTSSEHLFYGHLKLHQQNHLCDYPDTYLFCSYCSHTFDKIKDLMNHIKDVHQHDKYQCSKCFYRSCEIQSCSVHMDVYHSKHEQKTVLECEIASLPIDIDALFEKLIENRLKYVAPLRCKVCNISIFLLAEYLEHMNDHVESSPVSIQDLVHNEIKTLEMLFSMNHYGFYQCLYCLHGTDIQDDMRAHLANKHASEFSYVCKREADSLIKSVSPLSIKSTQLIKLINKKMVIEKFEGDLKDLENKDCWCKFNDKFDMIKSTATTSYIPTSSSSNFVINQKSGIVITNVYSISSETHLSSI